MAPKMMGEEGRRERDHPVETAHSGRCMSNVLEWLSEMVLCQEVERGGEAGCEKDRVDGGVED